MKCSLTNHSLLFLVLIVVGLYGCTFEVPETPTIPSQMASDLDANTDTNADTSTDSDDLDLGHPRRDASDMNEFSGDARPMHDGPMIEQQMSDTGDADCGPGCEECNGADDDGDGLIDEGAAPMDSPPCEVIDGLGPCAAGHLICSEGAIVCTPLQTPENERCDQEDNDCDGLTDEGVQNDCGECAPPPPEICNDADDDCDGLMDEGVRNPCGGCGDVPEEVCDGVDNDCNGTIDDDCPCINGQEEPCGSDVGVCSAGTRTCLAIFGRSMWGDCEGNTGPEGEESCDGRDNDCDGTTDEDLTRECGSAVGACVTGIQRCVGGELTACLGERTPEDEICDGLDNDCDGTTDEGIAPTDTQCGVGLCQRSGQRRCMEGALVDDCQAGTPVGEGCDNEDNDCDGEIDEALTRACGSAVGECEEGAETCAQGAWGECQGGVTPGPPEGSGNLASCNGRDDDCDGRVDEDFPGIRNCDSEAICVNGSIEFCRGDRGEGREK